MTAVDLRHPIPDPEPASEATSLVDWLRRYGVPGDRLEQAVADLTEWADELATRLEEHEGHIAQQDRELDRLRSKIEWARDILDDEPPELIEGERSTSAGDHPTVNVRHPDGRVIPIDEEMTGIIKGLWDRGILTNWCCQEGVDGMAHIGFGSLRADIAKNAALAFRALVPDSREWGWWPFPEHGRPAVLAVAIPREELANVERAVNEAVNPAKGTAAHRVVGADREWLICSCGQRFATVWEWGVHRNEASGCGDDGGSR
jgi:hypothetical protein